MPVSDIYQDARIFGKGIIYPIQVNARGSVDVVTGIALIRASIGVILMYEVGERYFNNEFGSRLRSQLEQPLDQATAQLIRRYTREAIEKWEKRVDNISAELSIPDGGVVDKSLSLHVTYREIATQREDTFVFPLYSNLIY